MIAAQSTVTLDKIIALCKRRGFVYQSADIYGGLNGVYDFGHLGSLLKKNIKQLWFDSMHSINGSMLNFEGSLLGHEDVWKASGHVAGFSDPMVDCLQCKHRYRTDDIDLAKACPHCGVKNWTQSREFNLMFKTELGAAAQGNRHAYLRPETAQAIFSNFKNIYATSRVKIPFGVTQIGKAFRNEITPKQFLFRMREFEQMEMEWFCKPADAAEQFNFWLAKRFAFYTTSMGLKAECLRLRHHQADELSHYSQGTADVEYNFAFGWKELEGIANRGSFDLTQHGLHSKKDHNIFDETTKIPYIPSVVETSVGLDRLFLTLLFDAYHEDVLQDQSRVLLRFKPCLAPIKAAFMPLTDKQSDRTYEIFSRFKAIYPDSVYDDAGSVGKRYRRQDEIGTPVCFTYDFESDQDHCITARDRNTTNQQRISLDALPTYMHDLLKE